MQSKRSGLISIGEIAGGPEAAALPRIPIGKSSSALGVQIRAATRCRASMGRLTATLAWLVVGMNLLGVTIATVQKSNAKGCWT